MTRANFKNPPQPVAEIDLHGYTKSDAIQRLTAFLDQVSRHHSKKRPTSNTECWVLVVTGSGAHSPYGPVLRTAVEDLLKKRQMKYLPQRGKGGFTVNADSGIVFYEPAQPTDTKVIVTDEAPSISYASILAQHRDRVRAPPTDMESEPLPAEVAATDAAIQESKMDAQQELAKEQKEKHQLQKALSMSVLEQQQEEEEEAKLLERALSLSVIEGVPKPNESEEEELQKALMASQMEEERLRKEEELELERALSMSVLQKEQLRSEEEEMLQQVLALSKLEDKSTDEELLAALEASKKECNDSQNYYQPTMFLD